MNDRELLERAARAMGCHGAKYEDGSWLEIRYGYTVAVYHDDLESYWNPLESDGDAFRLAVKLDISTRQQFAMVQAEYPWIDEEFNTRKVLCEVVLDDYCAATRRAIVRAAAEIGMRTDAPQTAG